MIILRETFAHGMLSWDMNMLCVPYIISCTRAAKVKVKVKALILFIQTLALYKSFTYLLTYLL